jgi:DNA-binding NtrC family response regulator
MVVEPNKYEPSLQPPAAIAARGAEAGAQLAPLNMIGASPPFHEMLRRIGKIARSDAPVLIEGETGAGKELAARAIHYLGTRRSKPFVPINCGAVPDSLIEAELFGHERGAFTDAKQARAGVIAQAQGGTLFLDEIDSLSLKAQVTLLRFLQDLRYRPLGHSKEIASDVRILAATNRPVASLVRGGEFRDDLLYRLNILSLAIPALRQRPGDAELLAQHYLARYCARYGLPKKALHASTIDWIRGHAWPGNVRELDNLIHREVLLADGDEILYSGGADAAGAAHGTACLAAEEELDFHHAKLHAVAQFEQAYLTRLMTRSRGNVTVAARLAGKERRALGKLLKKHRIDRSRFLA